jgi:hypothetical protein
MTERMTTTYRGHELIYYPDRYGTGAGHWAPADHGLPVNGGTIEEVRRAIDQWEIAKQVEGGVKVWTLDHSDPKFWHRVDAVFRSGGTNVDRTHAVLTRNFPGDPDSLYARPRGDVAMDTPEVAEAMDRAKAAYAELVAANDRWKKAKRAIPVMTGEEWAKLPERAK